MAGLPAPAAPSNADATYFANAAAIEHSYTHALASDQESLNDYVATFVANRQKLNFAEPAALTNIRNKANSEGLATSGQETSRAATQQKSFLDNTQKLDQGRQQTTDKINRAMTEAGETRNEDLAKEAAANEGRRTAEAEKLSTSAPTYGATPASEAPAAAPAAPRAPAASPQAPGSLPKITKITNQPITGNVRRAAAKKALGL